MSRGSSLPPVVVGEGCDMGVMIKKILLPVDVPHPSLRVMHQAATVAHHFHAEMVMLHVVTTESRAPGGVDHGPEHAGWDFLAEVKREAKERSDQSLGPALDDLIIRRLMVRGDATQAIVHGSGDRPI